MKKLGKRSSLESGTFFAYACNCNCGSVPCGTCNNCNDYKNPQSTGAYALSYKLSRKKRLEKCKSNKHVVEERLKEYCTLREYGCKFED